MLLPSCSRNGAKARMQDWWRRFTETRGSFRDAGMEGEGGVGGLL